MRISNVRLAEEAAERRRLEQEVALAREIQAGLLAAGIKADLPVALIENGSRDDQRVMAGTVDSIPALAGQARRGSPGLLIIGQVAALAETLDWFRCVQNVRKAA